MVHPARNALGFSIGNPWREPGTAMVTTAYDQDGTAVHVGEAQSGSGDGLICECGVPVVAKKGAERDWHFAHRAGLKSCRIAIDGQARRFLENAALDFRIALPPKDNRRGMVDAIVVESVVRAGMVVLLLYDQTDRRLLVVVEVKKSGARDMRELIGRSTLSTIFVSLVCDRTKTDDELRNAFCRSAAREWWRWKPELLTPLHPKVGQNGMLLPPLTEEALIEKIFRPTQR